MLSKLQIGLGLLVFFGVCGIGILIWVLIKKDGTTTTTAAADGGDDKKDGTTAAAADGGDDKKDGTTTTTAAAGGDDKKDGTTTTTAAAAGGGGEDKKDGTTTTTNRATTRSSVKYIKLTSNGEFNLDNITLYVKGQEFKAEDYEIEVDRKPFYEFNYDLKNPMNFENKLDPGTTSDLIKFQPYTENGQRINSWILTLNTDNEVDKIFIELRGVSTTNQLSIEITNTENETLYKEIFKDNTITIDLTKKVVNNAQLQNLKYSKIVFTQPEPNRNIVIGELIFIGANDKVIPPSDLFAVRSGQFGIIYSTDPAEFVTDNTEKTKNDYYQKGIADRSFYKAYVTRQSDKPNASVSISFSEKVKPPIMIKRMLLFTPSYGHGRLNTRKDKHKNKLIWTESIKGMKISWYNGDTRLHTMTIPQSVPSSINKGIGNYVELSPEGARYISREEFIMLLNNDTKYMTAFKHYEKKYVNKK